MPNVQTVVIDMAAFLLGGTLLGVALSVVLDSFNLEPKPYGGN
jgi:hypothetical protein